MTPETITISGGRYWSERLNGSLQPRAIKQLAACEHGRWTAVVDGREGHITINAQGWWFEPAGALSPAKQPEPRHAP